MSISAPNSLRLRLILAFMAMVGLTVFVGVTSFVMHREIREQVSVLRPGQGVDLGFRGLDQVGLEVEGFWTSGGVFIATGLEALPGTRRPKLRGALQGVDLATQTMTMYGLSIDISGPVEIDGELALDAATRIRSGQRLEVTCGVEDERWIARKMRFTDVKPSDKVKGTMTVRREGDAEPTQLELHGLVVSLEALPNGGLEDTSQDIATAMRLMLALLECRTEAHALAAETGSPAAALGLQQAHRDFELALSNGTDQHFRERIVALLPELELQVAELLRIALEEPAANVRERLAYVFEPFLEERLQPAVAGYFSDAEEELGERLRSVASRTTLTTRVALVTSAVAAIVALLLGVLVWRSIHTPLHALQEAAKRLGHGHLDTRVEVKSRDELGELAAAFNQMASELSATTMSIDNLENVFGSMAGALILLDPELRMTSANQAALDLLGYSHGELDGKPFELVCEAGEGGVLGSHPEVDFRSKSGALVAVSFSARELRPTDGTLQGYVCVAQDLTQRKHIEAEIRDALAEKELLLREVYHRVKNNMQVVSSMLAMQSEHSNDAQLVAGLEQSQARIRSMALIHEQLYQSTDLAHIDVRVYLDVLTQHLHQSFGRGDIRVHLCLDDLELDLDRSLACGLIVNELVTNAFTHGFPDGREGTIRVDLSCGDDDFVELRVSDDGQGLPPSFRLEDSDTLGMNLITTLSQQLGGTMTMDRANGLQVCARFTRSVAPRLVV